MVLMLDINSVEFYTIAFVVAMALVGLLMGRTEKKPPSTYIFQLLTMPSSSDDDDLLCIEVLDGGRVRLSRTGLSIGPEETVNLVFTVRDEQCSIVEKKSVRQRRSVGEPVSGEAIVKCLRPGCRYRMRYESQVTSKWATFTFDTSSPDPKVVKLNI